MIMQPLDVIQAAATGLAMTLLIAVLGIYHLLCPEAIVKRKESWGIFFPIYNLFPEGFRVWYERISGIILLIAALVIGLTYSGASEKEKIHKFHEDVAVKFDELKTPYEMGYSDEYIVEVAEGEDSENLMTLNIKDRASDPPDQVAQYIYDQANIFFKKQPPAQQPPPPGMETSPLLALGGDPTPAPEQETLEIADIMIQEAGAKWQAGDIQGSIQLAEKACQIKIRILGDNHAQVLQLKNQIAAAKNQLPQPQASSPNTR